MLSSPRNHGIHEVRGVYGCGRHDVRAGVHRRESPLGSMAMPHFVIDCSESVLSLANPDELMRAVYAATVGGGDAPG